MRGLAAALALTVALRAPSSPLPAAGSPLPAAGFPLRAAGAIRGRVDVRIERSLRDARPDPGALGMTNMRDPLERRRSVVYLETAPRAAFEQSEDRRARMDQRNERFVPHVLAIVAGTYVDFPNGDNTYHNVFSLSKTKEFNLGRYAVGKSKAVRFERPGIVRVFCDIHSHMNAFILVFAHRYFSVSDPDGTYRLENVPPGTYNVFAWNESAPLDSRRVVVPDAGGEVEVNFALGRR